MKNYTNCPACNETKFTQHLECTDFTVSKNDYKIVKCDHCSFAFTNPIPQESDIGSYYESEDYISHSNTSKGLTNFLYQKVRNYTLDNKIKLLKSLGKGKQILDIGSGTGEFLNHCQQNDFNIIGIEPSDKAREQAKSNFNISLKTEDNIPSLESNHFDFITMWHVLEHVYHLNDRIKEIYRLLSSSGHLIVAVPNYESYDASYYKEHWAAYDVPRHLYHFTPNTIKTLFKKHDMTVTQILPMKFDSFYVSMLSEKYKNESSNLINAFLTGLKSNLKAGKQPRYSSQIYIIQKIND